MEWTIPGTVLRCSRAEAPGIEDRFGSMFMAGGIVLSRALSPL